MGAIRSLGGLSLPTIEMNSSVAQAELREGALPPRTPEEGDAAPTYDVLSASSLEQEEAFQR